MTTLPGMPTRYGDPGFFACTAADLEPWNARPPRHLTAVRPAAAVAPKGVWLVLAMCARCARLRGYCSDHRLDWLFRDRDRTHR